MAATYRRHWVGVSRQSFQTLAVFHIPDANTLIKLNSHNISLIIQHTVKYMMTRDLTVNAKTHIARYRFPFTDKCRVNRSSKLVP